MKMIASINKVHLAAIAAASVLLAYVGADASMQSMNHSNTELDFSTIVQRAEAAQADYFLKIEGVDGESTVKGQEGSIEIQSFSWGVSNPGSHAGGGGGGSGKANFQDISIVKTVDKATPKLMEAVVSGKHIPSATLILVADLDRDGALDLAYYKITFKDVVITSFQQQGNSTNRPLENISFSYSKIIIEYIPVDATGKAGAPMTTGWDLGTNKKI